MNKPDRGWTLTAGAFAAVALGVAAAGSLTTSTERAIAAAPPAAPNCAAPVAISPSPTTGTLTGAQYHWESKTTGVVATITSNKTGIIRDLDVRTFLESTASGDANMTLKHTTPSGASKTVYLVSPRRDNGNRANDHLDNLFNGTLWDDQAYNPVLPYLITPAAAPTGPLATVSPEGKLAAFNGMEAAGTYELRIVDNNTFAPPPPNPMPDPPPPPFNPATDPNPSDNSTLKGFSLDIMVDGQSASEVTSQASNTTSQALPDGADTSGANPGAERTRTMTINAAAGQTVRSVEVQASVSGSSNTSDLRLTLVSPSGTEVVLTPGGAFQVRSFASTVNFVLGSNAPLSRTPADYATTVEPHVSTARFVGEPAAGDWTLKAQDRFSGDNFTVTGSTIKVTHSAGCAPPATTTTTTTTAPPPAATTTQTTTTAPPATTTTAPATPTAPASSTPAPAPQAPVTTPPPPAPPVAVQDIKLAMSALAKRYTVRSGKVLQVRTTLTTPAAVTVTMKRGKKVVRRVVVNGKAGRNVFRMNVGRLPGTYTLEVNARSANSVTAVRRAQVRVLR